MKDARAVKWIGLALATLAIAGLYIGASGANINVERGQSPLVVNTAITANSESCYSFTSEIVGIDFHSRGNNDTKIAFTSGTSGTTYFTVPPYWSADKVYLKNAESLCFQNAAATDTIEMIVWR